MSDQMKIILVVAALGLVGVMRYYFSASPMEPKVELAIEQAVELETGIDIFPAKK